jgi:hypothetical protein
MRSLALIGIFLAVVAAAKGAGACDVPGRQVEVEIVVDPPSAAQTAQSQTFLTEATRLDGKADIEESASATLVLSARAARRRAASIRLQAGQVSQLSQGGLFAKADKLDAEAASDDATSATYLARARLIRSRAKALRILSTRVLTTGLLTTQVLARVQLPAPPAGHPDRTPLRTLDAVPKIATTVVIARVQI